MKCSNIIGHLDKRRPTQQRRNAILCEHLRYQIPPHVVHKHKLTQLHEFVLFQFKHDGKQIDDDLFSLQQK